MTDADGYQSLTRSGGLQAERTALAWERTAVSMMVTGILLARYASDTSRPLLAVAGLAQTVGGAVVLVWAGVHYGDLHGPISTGGSIVHPLAVRIVGVATVTFSGCALALVAAVVATA